MEIVIQPTPAEGAVIGARIVEDLVRTKPRAVLGLATGGTPLGLYKELIRMHRENGLDFSKVTTFNLDEYVGLSWDHPCSYGYYMRENFFRHVNIRPDHINIPDGLTQNIPKYCDDYEGGIRAVGGIDLQVLGIGNDGHIGFSEPSSSLASRTRHKTLTQETIAANQRFFGPGEKVPHDVITMGVGTIMEARTLLMFAYGETKAEAVAAMVEGPVTAMCPASILQMHPQAVVVIDEPAARLLKRTEYYRYVYAEKPKFQEMSPFPVR